MDIDRYRKSQVKMLKLSHWIALLLVALAVVGYFFFGFSLSYIAANAAFGALLAPLILKAWKTGQVRYSALYGFLVGIGSGVVPMLRQPDLSGIGSIFLALYSGTFILLGNSMAFVAFRSQALRYIGGETVSAS
jgi:hypothetical protein